MSERVVLFPGQGAFHDGEPARLAMRHPETRTVFDEIDRVATRLGGRPAGVYVLGADAPSVAQLAAEAPDVLQLAIYGTTIALWRVLQGTGAPVGMVAGHSAGEIAALVAAGALTVAEGAEILVHRSAVLSGVGTQAGGMLMLGCSADRARDVLAAVGDPMVALAVRNAPRQTVISGPTQPLDTVARVAALLGIPTKLLTVAYPFHSPVLAAAVPEFAARIRHLEPRPPRTLVFSPILGRIHRPEDDLREHIAGALVAPVAFDRALDRLRDAGVRVFVECATAGTLGRLVQACLPESTIELASDVASPAAPAAPPRRPEPAALALSPVRELSAPGPSALAPSAAEPAAIGSVPGAPAGREALFADVVDMYAQALEYPPEVFTEDVKLEEELGIDSVKQTELMARAADRYGLAQTPLDFRLGDYDTMGKLVDYISAAGGTSAPRGAVVGA